MTKKVVTPSPQPMGAYHIEGCTIHGTAPTNEFDQQKVASMCEAVIALASALSDIANSSKRPEAIGGVGISIGNNNDR